MGALRDHPGLTVLTLDDTASAVRGALPMAPMTGGDAARALLAGAIDPVFLGLHQDRPFFAVGGPADPTLPAAPPALAGHARSMLLWHRAHRFCGHCGAATRSDLGGAVRICTGCATHHHPRTDPAVIMLVTGDDRVLLHRQHGWPPGLWSCLAGFVEPGETAEAAVPREVFEETGLQVGAVRYLASQPWPFPSSLMMAFTAQALGGTLTPDPVELEAARWFDRAEMAEFDDRHRENADGLFLARPGTIARWLIDGWRTGVYAPFT